MSHRSQSRRRVVNVSRRYTKTGGFNKLAGRAITPGSEIKESFFIKRRIIFIIIAILVVLPGLIALLT